ncbi:MAG TPA: RNA polymerase sigma factor [Polyangiaceae bacterium]|jgi:RNA polymerase sigma-70 factor (ECF subfamily)|nr:RNA polymerase sigma factor [Polyangiaceae bacterium]
MSPVRKNEPPRLRLVSTTASDHGEPAALAPSVDDSQLLAAMRSGDKSVASAFHDRVRPQVDRTLLRLFRRYDVDHEDLRQLALIELVMTIARFRGECSLDSWVGALTTRIVFKHLRRRQAERRLFGVLEREDAAPQSGVGSDPLVRNLMQHASQHLHSMDPNRAWAFFLHDVLGYELRELAQIMGISVSAAQSRLVRGRRELHGRFASDPELADLLENLGR